jgi:hypothetical protein
MFKLNCVRRRVLCGVSFVVLLGVVGWAGTAQAVPELYTIDASQSYMSVSGTLTVDLGPPLGALVMPLQSQVGNVAGATGYSVPAIPGGGTSNGLATSLLGQLLVDVNMGFVNDITFGLSQTFVVPGISGSWGPDAAGTPGTLSDAALGFFAEDAGLPLDVAIALRSTSLGFGSFSTLTPTGPGTNSFSHFTSLLLHGGAVAFDASNGINGAGAIPPGNHFVGAQPAGTLTDLGGGDREVRLPFDVNLDIFSVDIGQAVPAEANVQLTGEIVAYNFAIPEPSTALLFLTGLLAALGARRAREED